MLEEIAVVKKVESDGVVLHTQIKTTCGGCEQQSHCGTGVIARYLAPKPEDLFLPCNLDVTIGQKVVIGITEKAMLKLAFFIYLMPIVVLLGFAITLPNIISNLSEPLLITYSVIGVFAYFLLLKHIIAGLGWQRLEPRIIKLLPQSDEISVQNLL